MKLRLKTRTPVHIGTGINYGPGEFFVTRGVVNRVSLDKMYHALSQERKDEFLREIELKEEHFNLESFLRPNERDEIERYTLRNRYGVDVPNIREICECIKTGFDEPYIPGSSIKGSIRTALLWDVARNDPLFIDAIQRDLESGRNMKRWIGKRYESCIFSTKTKYGNPDGDPKYDLLKFLQVSDAHAIKQILRLDGMRTLSLGARKFREKPFLTHAEMVIGEYECEITLSPAILGALKHTDFDRLADRLNVLGITAWDLDNLEGAEEKVIAHIKMAMRRFVDAALEKECKLVGREDGNSFMEKLNLVKKEHMNNDILRIGSGVGTTYQTLFDIIEENDPDLAQEILRKQDLGKHRRSLSLGNIEPPYPKTFELTLSSDPMGWVRW